MPFILTVTTGYVARKTYQTLPVKIQDLQSYCDEKREELRKIAYRQKQGGLNTLDLT